MKVRHVNYSPDEFLVGVTGMRADEIGVYWVICSLIYSTGGPIKNDERLKRVVGCHGNRLKAVMEHLVELGKIATNGRDITVKRCEKELEKARIRSAKAAENGIKGGRPSNEISTLHKPDAFRDKNLTTNHKPRTTNHEVSQSERPTSETTDGKAFGLEESDYVFAAGEGYRRDEADWLYAGCADWCADKRKRLTRRRFRNWCRTAYARRDIEARRKGLDGGGGRPGIIAAAAALVEREGGGVGSRDGVDPRDFSDSYPFSGGGSDASSDAVPGGGDREGVGEAVGADEVPRAGERGAAGGGVPEKAGGIPP